jgi:hypothetical protein
MFERINNFIVIPCQHCTYIPESAILDTQILYCTSLQLRTVAIK